MSYSAQYSHDYYLRNREKKLAQAKEWRLRNLGKIRWRSKLASKAWASRNREYILWKGAKSRSKKNELEFKIELADILIPDNCPLLGIPIDRGGGGRMNPNSPSLDRIDNSLGYIPGNVWVISWKANRMKCDASLEDLINFSAGIQRWLHK